MALPEINLPEPGPQPAQQHSLMNEGTLPHAETVTTTTGAGIKSANISEPIVTSGLNAERPLPGDSTVHGLTNAPASDEAHQNNAPEASSATPETQPVDAHQDTAAQRDPAPDSKPEATERATEVPADTQPEPESPRSEQTDDTHRGDEPPETPEEEPADRQRDHTPDSEPEATERATEVPADTQPEPESPRSEQTDDTHRGDEPPETPEEEPADRQRDHTPDSEPEATERATEVPADTQPEPESPRSEQTDDTHRGDEPPETPEEEPADRQRDHTPDSELEATRQRAATDDFQPEAESHNSGEAEDSERETARPSEQIPGDKPPETPEEEPANRQRDIATDNPEPTTNPIEHPTTPAYIVEDPLNLLGDDPEPLPVTGPTPEIIDPERVPVDTPDEVERRIFDRSAPQDDVETLAEDSDQEEISVFVDEADGRYDDGTILEHSAAGDAVFEPDEHDLESQEHNAEVGSEIALHLEANETDEGIDNENGEHYVAGMQPIIIETTEVAPQESEKKWWQNIEMPPEDQARLIGVGTVGAVSLVMFKDPAIVETVKDTISMLTPNLGWRGNVSLFLGVGAASVAAASSAYIKSEWSTIKNDASATLNTIKEKLHIGTPSPRSNAPVSSEDSGTRPVDTAENADGVLEPVRVPLGAGMWYIVPEGTGPIRYENMRPSENDEVNGRPIAEGREPIDVFSVRVDFSGVHLPQKYPLSPPKLRELKADVLNGQNDSNQRPTRRTVLESAKDGGIVAGVGLIDGILVAKGHNPAFGIVINEALAAATVYHGYRQLKKANKEYKEKIDPSMMHGPSAQLYAQGIREAKEDIPGGIALGALPLVAPPAVGSLALIGIGGGLLVDAVLRRNNRNSYENNVAALQKDNKRRRQAYVESSNLFETGKYLVDVDRTVREDGTYPDKLVGVRNARLRDKVVYRFGDPEKKREILRKITDKTAGRIQELKDHESYILDEPKGDFKYENGKPPTPNY